MNKTAHVSLQISSRHKQDLPNSRFTDLLKQRAELRATKIVRARNIKHQLREIRTDASSKS